MTRHLHPAALLLALAGAIPEPAAAQGRQMAVFVSPNVVCRVAPSSSADVAGILRPNLGQQFLPRLAFDDMITDAGDRLWIRGVVQ